jgi:teichuronic acid exporter
MSRHQAHSAIALRGAAWGALQTALNKAATIVAMLCLTRLLQPSELGVAAFAASLGAFVIFLNPFVMGDVLLANGRLLDRCEGAAQWLTLTVALIFLIALIVASPFIQSTFPEKIGLRGLVICVAFRPLAEAIGIVPISRARIDLHFRRLAIIDGIIMLASTVAGVFMAWVGLSGYAIVIPPIAVLAARGITYWIAELNKIAVRIEPGTLRPVARQFLLACSAQYLANVLGIIETLFLGWFATAAAVGVFNLALQLATQLAFIAAFQIANVLQPMFGRVHDTNAGQVQAYLRTCRMIIVLVVPIGLISVLMAPRIFAVLLTQAWSATAVIFATLTIGQMFAINMYPTSAFLKAQGRFKIYFYWQLFQLTMTSVAYLTLCMTSEGAIHGIMRQFGIRIPENMVLPFEIAVLYTIVAFAIYPLATWLACRPAKISVCAVLAEIARCWSAPIAASIAAWVLIYILDGSQPNAAVAAMECLLIGPLAYIISVSGSALLDERVKEDLIVLRSHVTQSLTLFRSS